MKLIILYKRDIMEAYKSFCPTCKITYSWQGAKTNFGKTPEQVVQRHKKLTICKECGAEGLKTDLDHESDVGKEYDEIYKNIFRFANEIK